MRRWLILGLIILLISAVFVLAQDDSTDSASFDDTKSYDWLKNEINNKDLDVSSLSLGILALNNKGMDVSSAMNKLKNAEDATHCWPKGNCRVADTALATLALYKTGNDVSNNIRWLEDEEGALNSALSLSNWYIDIVTTAEGTCILTYGNNQTKEVETKIEDEGARISLDDFLNKNKPFYNIQVDCGNLPQGTIIVLSYVPSSTKRYKVINEESSKVEMKVPNGCYGNSLTDSGCNYLSSLYTSWALDEMGRDIFTNAYIESKVPASGDLEQAIVARTTGKPQYMEYLRNNQESDGSWSGGHIGTTAWAVFALSKSPEDAYQAGVDYLKRMVSANGHWNNNAKDTALALIALYGDVTGSSGVISGGCSSDSDCLQGEFCNLTTSTCESINATEICDDTIDNDGDGEIDCNDNDCSYDPACTGPECEYDMDCPGDEVCDQGECVSLGGTECNEDGYCDMTEGPDCVDCQEEEEGEEGCTSDEDCKEGYICKDGQCVEEKGFPWWILIVVLVLLALGGGIGYLFKSGKLGVDDFKGFFDKFKKEKPKKKPSFQQYQQFKPIRPQPGPQQRRPVAGAKKTKDDIELEKSLKEAEKLLHGKGK